MAKSSSPFSKAGLSSAEKATFIFSFSPGCNAITCCATRPSASAMVGTTPTTIVPLVIPRMASISATARRNSLSIILA